MKNKKELENYKAELDKEQSLSQEFKDIMLVRATLAFKINSAIEEVDISPNDILTVLVHLACGITVNCETPYHGTAFMLERMAEFYKHHELMKSPKLQEQICKSQLEATEKSKTVENSKESPK